MKARPLRLQLRSDGSVEIGGIFCKDVFNIQSPLTEFAQQKPQPDIYFYTENDEDFYAIAKIIYTIHRSGFSEGKIKQMFGRVQPIAPDWESFESERG